MVVNVFTPGHLDLYDSYGLIACRLIRHLSRLGVYVNAIPLGERLMDTQPADIAAIASRPIRPAFGGFLLGYPTGYDKYGALAAMGSRIAVTMFESTMIPPAWVPILNQLDGVIVPSKFCQDVFINCGVTAPVYVVPLGISEVYQPAERKRAPDDPFTFLVLGDRGRRKGWHHALNAFLLAFGEDMNYRLIIKRREYKVKTSITNPNIEVIEQDMTEEELYQLFLTADVLVNPNQGEGFGLLPREFAATGGLALATNWGGTAEDIEQWGLPIAYELVPAWQDFEKHQGLGFWAEPDTEALAVLMDVVAETRDSWRPKALARAADIHQMYSWEVFAETALRLWQAHNPTASLPLPVEAYA